MSARIPSGSQKAKFAQAMHAIFRTPSGKVLRTMLETEVLGTLSSIGPDGSVVPDRQVMLAEGQKVLALKLIMAADVDAPLVGTEEKKR